MHATRPHPTSAPRRPRITLWLLVLLGTSACTMTACLVPERDRLVHEVRARNAGQLGPSLQPARGGNPGHTAGHDRADPRAERRFAASGDARRPDIAEPGVDRRRAAGRFRRPASGWAAGRLSGGRHGRG